MRILEPHKDPDVEQYLKECKKDGKIKAAWKSGDRQSAVAGGKPLVLRTYFKLKD